MLSRLLATRAAKGLSWIGELAELDIAESGITPIRSGALLIPIAKNDGALLVWTFDHGTNFSHLLIARLTEDEADKVYAADPYSTGLLEPVRRHITNPWGIVGVSHGDDMRARPCPIIRHGAERLFVRTLDTIAAHEPQVRDVAVPQAQEFALGVTKELVFR